MYAEVPTVGDVLVVDDDPLVGNMIVNQIQRTGRACYLVDSYQAALQRLERSPKVDLVILDHGVQPNDLPSFVEKIRLQHATTTLIGSSGRDCRAEFAQAGVERFLMKPWGISELRDELNKPAKTADADTLTISESSTNAAIGDRCRPICDKLACLEGIVERKHASGRVTIRLDGERMLGVRLEIDADAIELRA